MDRWELSQLDASGTWVRVGDYPDHVEAITALMVLDAGTTPRRYQLEGRNRVSCPTIHDLRERVVDAGQRIHASGRSLSEFLRAWWLVGKRLCGVRRVDLDTVAAWVSAAGMVAPPPVRPSWRAGSAPGVDPARLYADWQRVVVSQIADLADFADHGPPPGTPVAGAAAPRPSGRVRATSDVWHNFDPASYLDSAMAGLVEAGSVDRGSPRPSVNQALSWADLAHLAVCGQGR